jgi:hypothetical protein
MLKFVPDVKKDIQKKHPNLTPTEILAANIGYEPRFLSYNQKMKRLSINLDGTRIVLLNIDNHDIKDM